MKKRNIFKKGGVMAQNQDMDKLKEKYGPTLKKFSGDMGVMAKKGEENFVKMSKILKIQLDIIGGTLQREKLFYDIGKNVAAGILKGKIDVSDLEKKYKKRLEKLQSEDTKKKEAIKRVKTTKEKKQTAKKNKS
jgi:hypothetical protein